MKTKKLNFKKILSMFVLLLVCSSMFMFVGCESSNNGELTLTSTTHSFTYDKNKSEAELQADYDAFFNSIKLTYKDKDGKEVFKEQTYTWVKSNHGASATWNLTSAGNKKCTIIVYGAKCELTYSVTVVEKTNGGGSNQNP